MSKSTLFHKARVESPIIRQFRECLEINEAYTPESLKKAYLYLSKQYHPDKNQKAADIALTDEKFKRVNEAYHTLKDETLVNRENEKFWLKILEGVHVGTKRYDPAKFFGIRLFPISGKSQPIKGYISTSEDFDPKLADEGKKIDFSSYHFEEEQSITDSIEYDRIELLMGGKMTPQQKEMLQSEYGHWDHSDNIERLPWVLNNLEAFYAFSDGDFETALALLESSYNALPRNIVITFRLGLCHEAMAHQQEKRRDFKRKLKLAIKFYEEALDIADNRPVTERQHCISIKKQLAYSYGLLGKSLKSYWLWRRISDLRPDSLEAQKNLQQFHLLGFIHSGKALESADSNLTKMRFLKGT